MRLINLISAYIAQSITSDYFIHAIRDQGYVDNNSQFLQQAVNDFKAKCLWTSPLTQQLTHKYESCYELSIGILMGQIS